jgi:hypothetical protein
VYPFQPASPADAPGVKKHKARVFLRYTENGIPWKWWGECSCGWECMSWQWKRKEDDSGSLQMTLDHIQFHEDKVKLGPVFAVQMRDRFWSVRNWGV